MSKRSLRPQAVFSAVWQLAIMLAGPLLWVPATTAEQPWPFTMVQGPFRVNADFPLARYKGLWDEMTVLQGEVDEALEVGTAKEPIDVYLFADQAVYRNYMRRYFSGVEPRRAMFIKSNSPGNVFAFDSPELAIDLRHEGTHALLHSVLPMVPLWLDEGIAEYFEVPAKERAFHHAHLQSIRRGLLWKQPPSLQRLEKIASLDEMGLVEYREAWAWVHFCLHANPRTANVLRGYLADIRSHRPPGKFSERLRAEMPNVDRDFVKHFRHWQ